MKRLLIVDDDKALLESMRIVFASSYDVCAVLSAEEAEKELSSGSIDVVLLDVVLPGRNGVELLTDILMRYPHLPVVMISASSSIRPVLQALEKGACDYIRKPFDIAELRLVVDRALQSTERDRRLADLEKELAVRPVPQMDRSLKEAVEDYERALIEKALLKTGGVQTRAAKELGTTRRILRYRIEKLHINAPA